MALSDLLQLLGDEVEDVLEETYLLFSHDFGLQDLGMIDPRAQTLDITIADRDFTICQSPPLLLSSRAGGTTGAALWKITPHFAEWLCSSNNVFFKTSSLTSNSVVLELGSGISGIVASILAPKIHTYIATDQRYVLKLLNQNIAANGQSSAHPEPRRPSKKTSKQKETSIDQKRQAGDDIRVLELDWETSSLSTLLSSIEQAGLGGAISAIDAVIACDCIYNESLIIPFVQTCVQACIISNGDSRSPTAICIIAQQLRSADVFEAWLTEFHRKFRVWRVPVELLSDQFKANSGLVVHVAQLREPS